MELTVLNFSNFNTILKNYKEYLGLMLIFEETHDSIDLQMNINKALQLLNPQLCENIQKMLIMVQPEINL